MEGTLQQPYLLFLFVQLSWVLFPPEWVPLKERGQCPVKSMSPLCHLSVVDYTVVQNPPYEFLVTTTPDLYTQVGFKYTTLRVTLPSTSTPKTLYQSSTRPGIYLP